MSIFKLALPVLGLVVLGSAVLDAACHTAAAQEGAAPAAATTPTAPTSTTPAPFPVGVIAASDRVRVVSHKRRGVLGVAGKDLLWAPSGLERRYNGGIEWIGAGDASWWRTGDPSPQAQSIDDLLAMAGGVGDWVDAKDRGKGRYLTFATLSGQQTRVGMLPGGPTASIVLMVPPASPHGTASRGLSLSHGFQISEAGVPSNTLPSGATALPTQAPSTEQSTAWKSELAKLRGGAVSFTWATMVDLDRDGTPEGALCVKGGSAQDDCYVVDEEDGQRRWYSLSTLDFDGGDAATAPLAFKHGDGVYLMHAVPERKLLLQVRWTGSDYVAHSVM